MDRDRLPGRALAEGFPGPSSHLGTVMFRGNCAVSHPQAPGRKKGCTEDRLTYSFSRWVRAHPKNT